MATSGEEKPLAFVLMPFDAEFDDVYSDLIVEPLESVGFTVRRADSLLNQRNILADVVTGIADADLIVADVTGLNPNVMYELGLAHALGKRTVMITQTLEQIPFDLRPYRANEYSLNFKLAANIAETIAEIGAAVIAGQADFSNPIQDFASNSMTGGAQVQSAPRSRSAKPHAEESDDSDEEGDAELGFLEGLELLQASSERTKDTSERIAAVTTDIGSKFEAGTARLQQIQKNLGPDKALQPSLALMRDLAKELDAFADNLAPLNESLRKALGDVVTGANVVARVRSIENAKEVQSVRDEIASLDSLSTILAESYFSTSTFAESIGSLPPMESHLTRASRHGAAVVADTASILESAQAEIDRVRGLLAARIEGRATSLE